MDALRNSKKDILVCIPAYNAGNSIIETIKSVLSQSYKDVDVLVVDNQSIDNTAELVRSLKEELGEERLHLTVNNKSLGRIGNWNECLRIFRGTSHKYIKFVFAGDTLEPSCLEKLVQGFHTSPHLGLVAVGYYVHGGNGRAQEKISFVKSNLFGSIRALWSFFQKGNWVGAPIACMVSRRAALSATFSEKLAWTADWKFYIDIARAFDSVYLPDALANFYISERKYYKNHKFSLFSRLEELYLRLYSLFQLGKRAIRL